MVRSVVVLVLIVGVVYAIGSFIGGEEQERPVRAVDYSGQLSAARGLADYPVLAPRGLGEGWVPTSVDVQSSGGTLRWHLGYLTPAEEYVGLEQADIEPQSVVGQYVGRLRPAGRMSVSGEAWQVYRGGTDNALVRRNGDVVTIVVGTAPTDVLGSFARSLASR